MSQAQTEQVTFPSKGADLAATLFLPTTPGPCPAMILCHGAGEFKEHYYELCEHLAERGVAALAVDMHGHGESGGDRFHVEIVEGNGHAGHLDRNRVKVFDLATKWALGHSA